MAGEVQVRRIHDEPDPGDGTRVLVDHMFTAGAVLLPFFSLGLQ